MKDEREVDHLNRSYTSMRLEYKMKLDFHILTFSVLPAELDISYGATVKAKVQENESQANGNPVCCISFGTSCDYRFGYCLRFY